MSRKLPREDIFSLPEANLKTFEKTTFKNVLLKSFKCGSAVCFYVHIIFATRNLWKNKQVS